MFQCQYKIFSTYCIEWLVNSKTNCFHYCCSLTEKFGLDNLAFLCFSASRQYFPHQTCSQLIESNIDCTLILRIHYIIVLEHCVERLVNSSKTNRIRVSFISFQFYSDFGDILKLLILKTRDTDRMANARMLSAALKLAYEDVKVGYRSRKWLITN